MASNFRISIHRNSDNLHLKLIGDFDGTSAYQVINTLKSNCTGASRVFIHTNCLRDIHPFGRDIFHKHLSTQSKQTIQIVFTGENANEISLR